jgi:hypothetical protein
MRATLQEWERRQVLAVRQRVVSRMEAEGVDASPVLTTGDLTDPPNREAIPDTETLPKGVLLEASGNP